MTALTANHSAFANIFDLLENLTQEPKLESNIFIAVGYNDRVDRRDDRSQRVEDKQDFVRNVETVLVKDQGGVNKFTVDSHSTI